VVSVTDLYGRVLGFLDRSRYFFFQVAPQLCSRDCVVTAPDPLLLRKCGSAGNRTRTSGSVARNSGHRPQRRSKKLLTTGINTGLKIGNKKNFWIVYSDDPKRILCHKNLEQLLPDGRLPLTSAIRRWRASSHQTAIRNKLTTRQLHGSRMCTIYRWQYSITIR
jgi:hypothetical protein